MKTVMRVLLGFSAAGLMLYSVPGSANGLFGDDGLELILGITAGYILNNHSARVYEADYPHRRDRRRGYHSASRDRSYYRNYNSRRFDRGFSPGPRNDFGPASFTSEPIRGGSSRRTRIIANPFSDRIVTGITLTGIDNGCVHIKDVVSYPGRYLVSPLGYTLSAYQPLSYINTGHYIDYISVAAKRREYFTVTFHYD